MSESHEPVTPTRKSVTLYLSDDCVEIIRTFGLATMRSNSQAAEFLVSNGAANYDVKSASPRRVAARKTPTARNTKVKQPDPVKLPAQVVKAAEKAAETTKTRGRKPKAASQAAPVKTRKAATKATKPTSVRRRKRAAAPEGKQAA